MKKSISLESIQKINLFESITKTRVKNFFIDDELILYIVNEGEAGKAIGKKGINVKKLVNIQKKKIKIIEYDKDPIIFIKNIISIFSKDYLKINSIEKEDNTIIIKAGDRKSRGILIGRDKKNLKRIQEIISKYFNIDIRIE